MTKTFTIQRVMTREVVGIPSYWAECAECPEWRCHRQDHDTQEQALTCAKRHGEHKHQRTGE